RQGGHHSAQKSTSTGPLASATSRFQFSLLRTTTSLLTAFVLLVFLGLRTRDGSPREPAIHSLDQTGARRGPGESTPVNLCKTGRSAAVAAALYSPGVTWVKN